MPTIKTARTIAENALKTIGAFPASQSSPDEGELKDTLDWLEMILSYQLGIRPVAGYWQTVEIPLEAGIGEYQINNYIDEAEASHIFSAFIVDNNGNTDPVAFIYNHDAAAENLQDTGEPDRMTVTKDHNMKLKLYPTPTQTQEDQGLFLRLRFQTYNDTIDKAGNADEDIKLRPSWYLWLIKRLSYEIGSGPVRRLTETELKRIEDDCEKLEHQLLARDGQYTSPKPPVTEPISGSID